MLRDKVARKNPLIPVSENVLHLEEHGSIKNEMITRASHEHPLFKDGNSKVHFLIEEAVRGASCAALLKPLKVK